MGWRPRYDEEDEQYSIVSNLSCPKCDSFVEVYLPKEIKEWNMKKG